MMYKFVKQASSVDSEAVKKVIERIESKYQMTLPTAYRDYAMNCDGAEIRLQFLDVDGYQCEVSNIIPLHGEGLTFEKIVDNDRIDGFLSQSLYPVASDRGGDIYYWDCRDNAVYLILSDDIEHPFFVSVSVEEFFALFR